MTYFHPRDFDAGQPLIPGLSKIRKFKSYTGIKKTSNKLSSIIEQNSFNELKTADLSLIPVNVINL
jgi:hypothetical protein